MNLTEFFVDAGKPLPYHPKLANSLGINANAMILLSFVGWRTFEDTEGGWVECGQKKLLEETALSFREQETARAKLRELNLIQERNDRLAHKFYIRLFKKVVEPEAENEADAGSAFREKQIESETLKAQQPDAGSASASRGKRVSTYKSNNNQDKNNTNTPQSQKTPRFPKRHILIDDEEHERLKLKWNAVSKEVTGTAFGLNKTDSACIKEKLDGGLDEAEFFDVFRRALKALLPENGKFSYLKMRNEACSFCKHFGNIKGELDAKTVHAGERGQIREGLKAKIISV